MAKMFDALQFVCSRVWTLGFECLIHSDYGPWFVSNSGIAYSFHLRQLSKSKTCIIFLRMKVIGRDKEIMSLMALNQTHSLFAKERVILVEHNSPTLNIMSIITLWPDLNVRSEQ